VAVPGDPHDASLRDLYALAASQLPADTRWFDVHTHTGSHDPDGFAATAGEIIAGLDRGGHAQALVFALQEPGGYPTANDRVLAEAAASGGRLIALARLDPTARTETGAPAAPIEARRCLDAGAVGLKLHPRAENFELSDPVVSEIVALAHERRLPVIVHAGRGIPSLGRDAVVLAQRFPDARLILAHAGISDLAWIWREAAGCPNLFFDTAWWNVADLRALFALVPPGQILYGSDMPYGSAVFCGLCTLRVGLSVGLAPEVLAQIVGGQLKRLLTGEPGAHLGPPPRTNGAAPGLAAERAVQHLAAAISRAFVRADAREPLALARLACDVPLDDPQRPLLVQVQRLIVLAEGAYQQEPTRPTAVLLPAVGAALVAGTPQVPVPAV
jgi:predicted TIM-barrel fold metal-dependent hydrolase